MRYTEYHANKAVIKDKALLPDAMEKLAKVEDVEETGCKEYMYEECTKQLLPCRTCRRDKEDPLCEETILTREELLKQAKPVLFNAEMVRAILEGRKTVTRRVVKFLDGKNPNWTGYIKDGLTLYNGTNEPCNKKPPCKKGDYLYVRETWTEEYKEFYYRADYDSDYLEPCETLSGGYPADCRYYPGCVGCTRGRQRIMWHPSIHMPKEAARIFLKVTDVRVERLQDITEEQAEAEGIRMYSKDLKLWKYAVTDDWWIEFHNKHKKSFIGSWWQDMPKTAKEAFYYLWYSTIKKADLDKYEWEANPWVWVIEFERVEV